MRRALFVAPLALSFSIAHAEAGPPSSATYDATAAPAGEVAKESSPYGIGARVGGYGFRQIQPGEASPSWDDCRMDGIGIFGERRFGDHIFVEGGIDHYFAKQESQSLVGGMDRHSTLASVASGVRMWPRARVVPAVHLGAGVEYTEARMLSGDSHDTSRVLPFGFLGAGADVRIGDHLKLGAMLRFHVMGHFEHSHSVAPPGSPWVTDAGSEMEVTAELASQAQFYARYDL